MLPMFLLFIYLTLGNVRSDTEVRGRLFGPNVCADRKEDTKQVLVSLTNLSDEKEESLCWGFPPWCETTTGRGLVDTRTVSQDIKHEILTLKCCDGYQPSENELSCLPMTVPRGCTCPNENYKCNSELECVCLSGFDGPSCQDIIPSRVVANPDGFWSFGGKVGVLVISLAALAVFIAVILRRKRYSSSSMSSYELLDGTNKPSV